MKNLSIIIIGLVLFLAVYCVPVQLAAQDRGSDRSRGGAQSGDSRGGRSGGPPPWMQGGGGSPPWMQGGGGGSPPWMQGGGGGSPPWMQGGGSSRSGGSDAERMVGMLRSMDRNGNGKLEQDEIPEYRRSFVSSIVTRIGGDPNRTIDLDSLARRAASSGGEQRSDSRSSSRSSSSTASAIATDPLVPYFGEQETQPTAVLGFGQREAVPKVASRAASGGASGLSQSDQIVRAAREIMNRYDKNKNGTLDKDKGEWNGLPFKPDNADKNRDARVSMSELINSLGGKSGAVAGAAAVATRQSEAYDRLPQGVPTWFFERDKDTDGQLTMMEYANNQPWTEAVADEFLFLDKNNDGTATVDEVFAVLKQVDEEKRLKEERELRDKDRLRGAGAAPLPVEQPLTAGSPPSTPPATPEGGATPAVPASVGPSDQPPSAPRPATPPTETPSTAPYASGSAPAQSSSSRSSSYRSSSSSRSSSYSDGDRDRYRSSRSR